MHTHIHTHTRTHAHKQTEQTDRQAHHTPVSAVSRSTREAVDHLTGWGCRRLLLGLLGSLGSLGFGGLAGLAGLAQR